MVALEMNCMVKVMERHGKTKRLKKHGMGKV
jgi:hypothetical protein